MPKYRIGAHPYVFVQYKYDFDKQFDEIFDTIADAGYQTIELATQMLGVDDWKNRIDKALERTGLELIGASNGQQMWNIEQYENIISAMDDYSDRLAALNGKSSRAYA